MRKAIFWAQHSWDFHRRPWFEFIKENFIMSKENIPPQNSPIDTQRFITGTNTAIQNFFDEVRKNTDQMHSIIEKFNNEEEDFQRMLEEKKSSNLSSNK